MRERSHGEPGSQRRIQGSGLLFYNNSFRRRTTVVLSGGSASNDLTIFYLASPLKVLTNLPRATLQTKPPTQESFGGKPHPNHSTYHLLLFHLSKQSPIKFSLFKDVPSGNGRGKAQGMYSCLIW